MYYVVRKGENIINYHARFYKVEQAKVYAEELKKSFSHNYDILKLETVWTTQTLAEIMEE
jgi:hypothetical protein